MIAKVKNQKGKCKLASLELTKATLSRLPLYIEYISSLPSECEYISSSMIAKALELGEVQVRKDLNLLSGAGKPKIGYKKQSLLKRLNGYIEQNKLVNAVICGAGKLGKALFDYRGFEKYGLKISVAFEKDESLIGKGENGKEILDADTFEEYAKNNLVTVGIIAVPFQVAQGVADRLVQQGVKTIWNFAPIRLKVPKGVTVQQEDMALSLAYLSYINK
jgi:redox-sensing transcriptional repressor